MAITGAVTRNGRVLRSVARYGADPCLPVWNSLRGSGPIPHLLGTQECQLTGDTPDTDVQF